MISLEEWRTLEPLLDAALDLEPTERADYLDSACAGDAVRRARLAGLLAACERGDRLLVTPVESFASVLAIPDVLGGRYRVTRVLGQGGMATVYLADDTRHRRQVAVKVLDPWLGNALGPKRFLKEIGIAARLQHPNILPLFDSGEAAGSLFYVMPYVEGESLRDRLEREGRLPIADAVQLACEVGDALQHAHTAGVTHRDIKPGNILLSQGHALVADFGIARAISASEEESLDDSLTASGLILGTPGYMSPEQLTSAWEVDARTDIYSLACVTYEMLAGAPPFGARTSRREAMRRLTETAPSVRTLREDAPPAVEQALSRALAREPSDRFPSVGAFVEALRQPGPSPAARRATAWTPRALFRWPGATAPALAQEARAAFVTLAVLAVGWAAWQVFSPARTPPGRIQSLVVLPPHSPWADSARPRLEAGLHEALITELDKLRSLSVTSHTTTRTYAGTAKSLSQVATELRVDGVAEMSVTRERDSIVVQLRVFHGAPERLLWKATFRGARSDMVTLPREIARQLATGLGVPMTLEEQRLLRQSRPVDARAWELYLQGRYLLDQLNAESVAAADSVAREAIARDPQFPEAHALLADVLTQLSYWKDVPPMDIILEAEREASRALELDSTLAVARVRRVDLRSTYTWDWDAHEAEFRRILTLNPGSVEAHIWYGVLLATLGRPGEGVAQTAEAVRLDPVNLLARNVHIMALDMDGRYADAVAQAQQVLKLNPNYPIAYGRMARALVRLGLRDSALRTMQRGYALNPDSPLHKGQMASVYALAGETRRARPLLDTLLAIAQRRWVAPTTIAQVYNDLGVVDSTVAWLERAYAVRDINLPFHLRLVSPDLRASPRLRSLMRRMNLLDERGGSPTPRREGS